MRFHRFLAHDDPSAVYAEALVPFAAGLVFLVAAVELGARVHGLAGFVAGGLIMVAAVWWGLRWHASLGITVAAFAAISAHMLTRLP